MQKCLTLNLAFPVTLSQEDFDSFTVQYGKQVKTGLNYADAASELGACIMHALACDGHLDNRERPEAIRHGDAEPYHAYGELAL